MEGWGSPSTRRRGDMESGHGEQRIKIAAAPNVVTRTGPESESAISALCWKRRNHKLCNHVWMLRRLLPGVSGHARFGDVHPEIVEAGAFADRVGKNAGITDQR